MTPFEKAVHDLSLYYVQSHTQNQTRSASSLAELYMKAHIEITRKFKDEQFDPMEEAPSFNR